ncbi:methyltransferase [Gammaproteobacteria bacterium 45_16_T64]|nr:methyltransferase [Gammaproteobacteria bacterium 45_16_T64]
MPVPAHKWSMKESLKMDDEQFILWQALLEDRTGMQISAQRKSFLETSLAIRMREVGLQDYDAYYEKLMSGLTGEVEWATLVDRLTVQETSFFRHTSSFELVHNYCDTRLKDGATSVDVWSVGCSTGEEPYSLAMMLNGLTEEYPGKYWGITATDISLPALSKARQGIYSKRKLDLMSDEYKARYFSDVPESRKVQVNRELKDRICFAQVNVLELESAPMAGLDVIFCQNLLIYFRRWRKRDIVTHLAERLAPGGLMVLGIGEVLDWSHPDMERVPYENTLAFARRNG